MERHAHNLQFIRNDIGIRALLVFLWENPLKNIMVRKNMVSMVNGGTNMNDILLTACAIIHLRIGCFWQLDWIKCQKLTVVAYFIQNSGTFAEIYAIRRLYVQQGNEKNLCGFQNINMPYCSNIWCRYN